MLALPSQEGDLGYIDEQDQATKLEMDRIRNQCEVWIEVLEDRILIFAFSESSLLEGLQRVRTLLLAYAQGMVCKTIALVHQSACVSNGLVVLKPTRELRGVNLGTDSRWRGVARARGPRQERKQESDDEVIPLTAHSLSSAILRAVQSICPFLGELRVRVHLGILSLAEKQSGAFKMIMEEGARRGQIYVHHG